MCRLGIFVFYDENGIVDEYVDYLLKELRIVCQDICFVVNGIIKQGDLYRLKKYTTNIYIRQNIGYDAGAYKDVLINIIPSNEWKNYDEIVLMNDTVFGPVYPLKNLWNELQDDFIDFWGLTRHPKLILENGKVLNSHIQSFFLVIRKRMLISSCFLSFWTELPYPTSYQSAVDNFELRFTVYFEKRGFYGKTFMDDMSIQCEGNPYLYYSYDLIKTCKIPFMKKKSLLFETPGYENALDAVEYIEKEFKFDLNIIWRNIIRLCKNERFDSILNYYDLEKFYKGHKRIFIYGAGKYGKKMWKYFRCRKWRFEKFLVSENTEDNPDCCNYSDVCLEESDGVILALGRLATEEVLESINKDLEPDQLFILRYDRR